MIFSEQYHASKLRESADRLPLGSQFVNSILNEVFNVDGYCISMPHESVDIVLHAPVQNRLYSMSFSDYESGTDQRVDEQLAHCKNWESAYLDSLQKAETELRVGTVLRHYKNPRQTYKVTGHSIDVMSPEVVIHYIAQYGYKLPFSRTLTDFCGTVSLSGIETLRFSVVN